MTTITMLKQTATVLLILIYFLSGSTAIIFTLPHKLASVFMAEEKIISILQSGLYESYKVAEYLDSAASRIAQVPILGDDVSSDMSEHHLENVLEKLVGNPLHVYSMVARVTHLLPHLTEEVEQLDKLVSYKGNYVDGTLVIDEVGIKLPNSHDLEGVASSIARIQFVYRYDPVELSKGIVGGVSTAGRLRVPDMMYIAGLCYKNEDFALAVEWAEAAQQMSPQGSIAHFISKVKAEHDLKWKSPDGETYPNEEFFVHKFGGGAITGRELRLKEENSLKGLGHIFYKLCRGEKVGIDEVGSGNLEIREANLCRLTNLGVPYFKLAPVRLEELFNNPTLHVFHQVLSQKEISLLKSSEYHQGFETAQTGNLDEDEDSYVEGSNEDESGEYQDEDSERSENGASNQNQNGDDQENYDHSNENEEDQEDSNENEEDQEDSNENEEDQEDVDYSDENKDPKRDIRVQANVWISDEDNPDFHKLSQKTGAITRLECAKTPEQLTNAAYHDYDPAEPFQVGVYPPGGYYSSHHDSHNEDDPLFLFNAPEKDRIWFGNRIATLMYYLSDVNGGRTAFPNLGLSVAPEKGSAVFWFNLDDRGAKDELTVHGACPTTLGIKWVSNKWISEGAQIWRRPCNNITKTSIAMH